MLGNNNRNVTCVRSKVICCTGYLLLRSYNRHINGRVFCAWRFSLNSPICSKLSQQLNILFFAWEHSMKNLFFLVLCTLICSVARCDEAWSSAGNFDGSELSTESFLLLPTDPLPYSSFLADGTQKQYELVMGSNPSQYKGDARPVEKVSYNMLRGENKGTGWPANNDVDETSFFGVLRAKTNLTCDLPTEAQWEFACRAGTTTALNSGKNLSNKNECEEMAEVGRYSYNKSDGKGGFGDHTTVGSYLPNAWGLYDMHGNIRELCLDWRNSAYDDGPAVDPRGPGSANNRVLRGGSCSSYAYQCRSAKRDSVIPTAVFYNVGFRVFIIK